MCHQGVGWWALEAVWGQFRDFPRLIANWDCLQVQHFLTTKEILHQVSAAVPNLFGAIYSGICPWHDALSSTPQMPSWEPTLCQVHIAIDWLPRTSHGSDWKRLLIKPEVASTKLMECTISYPPFWELICPTWINMAGARGKMPPYLEEISSSWTPSWAALLLALMLQQHQAIILCWAA